MTASAPAAEHAVQRSPAGLSLARLARLARKELRETLRDRRTIVTLILMPLTPLAAWARTRARMSSSSFGVGRRSW